MRWQIIRRVYFHTMSWGTAVQCLLLGGLGLRLSCFSLWHAICLKNIYFCTHWTICTRWWQKHNYCWEQSKIQIGKENLLNSNTAVSGLAKSIPNSSIAANYADSQKFRRHPSSWDSQIMTNFENTYWTCFLHSSRF